MKKKRSKKKAGKGISSILAKESIYIQQLRSLPERERTYKAFGFLEYLRNDSSVYRNQRLAKFLGNKTYRDIILCNMNNRQDRIVIDFHVHSCGIEEDLEWAANVICSHKDEINKYISLRDDFYKAYMTGDGEKAEAIANRSKSLFGLNIWSTQAELLAHRINNNTTNINEYLDENKVANENSESLISSEVTKIDPSISASRFKFSVGSNMEEMQNSGNIPTYKITEFFHMYSPDIEIEKPEFYISNFQMLPIVDYYNYCLRLVRHLSLTELRPYTNAF